MIRYGHKNKIRMCRNIDLNSKSANLKELPRFLHLCCIDPALPPSSSHPFLPQKLSIHQDYQFHIC